MLPYTPSSRPLYQEPSAQDGQSFRIVRFSGADSRSAWWGMQFLCWLIYILGALLLGGLSNGYGALFFFLCLIACAYLSLASGVRRLHDRGKSGMWMLLAFVPIIGQIWMLIELGFLPGEYA